MEDNDKKKLFNLIQNSKYDEIITFMDDNPGLDYNFSDEGGIFFIMHIVAANNVKILKKILTFDVRIDLYDEDGKTILYNPIKFGNIDIIKLLLKHNTTTIGIPIHLMTDNYGKTAIHYTLQFKNWECFELFANITNLTLLDSHKNTILHMAINTNSVKFVERVIYLTKNTSIINSQNKYGDSPLHFACGYNVSGIVKLLLDNNADPNQQNYEENLAPIHIACENGYSEIVKILLDFNIDINVQDSIGYTPLHYCIINDRINILKLFTTNENINAKINFNLYDEQLNFPLHLILTKIPENIYEFLDLLLPKTDLNFQNNTGNSCLNLLSQLSIWKKYENILKNKKLDVTLKNNKNMSPIQYIIQNSKNNLNDFIDIVVDSYYNELVMHLGKNNLHQKKPWFNKWEEICNTNELSCKKEIQIKIKKIIGDSVTVDLSDCKNKSYPIHVGSKKCLKFESDEPHKFNTLTGNILDILSGLFLLKDKYKSTKVILDKFDPKNTSICTFFEQVLGYSEIYCIYYTNFILWYKNILHIEQSTKELIITSFKNSKVKNIVIFLSLNYEHFSHANIIIYSKDTNEIERFDPFGFDPKDKNIDIKLSSLFKELLPGVKYIAPKDYMNSVGFQKVDVNEKLSSYIGDPFGYCVAWSIWYADLRLTYPTIQRDKLIKYLVRHFGEQNLTYRSVIRNYTKKITDIRDKILTVVDVDINAFNNLEFDDEKLKSLLEQINKKI